MAGNITRRGLLRQVLAGSAGVLLASCASKEVVVKETVVIGGTPQVVEKVVTATAAPPQQVKLSIEAWSTTKGPNEAKAFMEIHPEITVEAIPSGEGKLDAMIAAGTPPDVFVLVEVSFIRYLKGGVILNLAPLIAADPQFDLSAYYEGLVKVYSDAQGDPYGLVNSWGAQLLYYNKTLIEKAGLQVPEVWTWESYREIARATTSGEGVDKTYGCMPHDWFAPQFGPIWQNKAEVFSADGLQCTMDTPEAIEALEFMVAPYREGYCPSPQQVSGMGATSEQLWAAGRVALYPNGHWVSKFPTDEWGVVANTENKTTGTFLHTNAWGIAKVTKEPKWAWELVKIGVGERIAREAILTDGLLPSLKTLSEEWAKTPPNWVRPELAKIWSALDSAGRVGRAYSHVLRFDEFMGDVWGPTWDKLWAGDLTPETAGKAMAEAGDPILNQE